MKHKTSQLLFLFFTSLVLQTCEKQGSESRIIREAQITARVVSMRTDPVVLASEITFLHKGDTVKILNQTSKPFRIGKSKEYWYKVRLKNDLEGWVYGANLSIGSGTAAAPKERELTSIKEELERAVVGKWWHIRKNGSTGYGRIYFWSDGTYKHGLGRGELKAEGKYTIDPKHKKVLLDKGSFMGEELEFKMLGSEYRLYGKRKGRTMVLKRVFIDPDAPDDPGEEKQTEEKTNTTKEK